MVKVLSSRAALKMVTEWLLMGHLSLTRFAKDRICLPGY